MNVFIFAFAVVVIFLFWVVFKKMREIKKEVTDIEVAIDVIDEQLIDTSHPKEKQILHG